MNRYPLLLMFALLALSWPLSLVLPLTPFDVAGQAYLKIIGYILLGTGILLLLSAAGLFKKIGTTIDPTKAPDKLVTTGIYQLSRNPMYLGMLMTLSGAQLALNSLAGISLPIRFFIIMNKVVIPREEQMVAEVFGSQYDEYKTRTRRWI
ncbi:MAG: isoprenylcysteine carboxylmethyltransferase family protein [Burkholderiales bacterium]|nr:isoprenylcysteine carboxylmethyltransferase family protein [Burkholderiales bacterium]